MTAVQKSLNKMITGIAVGLTEEKSAVVEYLNKNSKN